VAVALSLSALLVLIAIAAIARWLCDNPRGDPITGLVYHLIRWYVRRFHRVEFQGLEHLPAIDPPGPLIIAANHTAGVDPLLVQAACWFEPRWLMAQDMMLPRFRWIWEWVGMIPIQRDARDRTAIRAAVAHLHEGGVIGVFPEGGLERPARQVLPFQPGVGALVRRSGAPVMLAWIEGTPQADPAWASLWRTSRSRVRFLAPVIFPRTMSAEEIAADLRQRLIEASGWPANDEPPITTPEGCPAA
jgi:1-acyl-sn-glycerol-3-phosphate acyltransferase